jgi:hypothetical protein
VPEGDLERVTGGVTLRDGSLVARENDECEKKREREREERESRETKEKGSGE